MAKRVKTGFKNNVHVYVVIGRDGKYYVYAGSFRVGVFSKIPTPDDIKQYMMQHRWIKPDEDVVIDQIVSY